MNADNLSRQGFSFWGKLAQEGSAYHPELCHMIDVGMVTQEIWRQVYPHVGRQRLADELHLPVDEAERWVVFVAALHDLGKASAAFQLRKEAEHLQHQYSAMGSVPINISAHDSPGVTFILPLSPRAWG